MESRRVRTSPAGHLAAGCAWTDDEVRFDTDDEATAAVCRTAWRLAADLRARRGATGLTVSQVADAAGVRRQTIADVLSGRTWPDLVTLARLAHVLGVELTLRRPEAARG